MSTQNKKHPSVPPIETLIARTQSNALLWRRNNVRNLGLPLSIHPTPDRTAYNSEYLHCVVRPYSGIWYDSKMGATTLILLSGVPTDPDLPLISELFSVDYDGNITVVSDPDGCITGATPLLSLFEAVEGQWITELEAEQYEPQPEMELFESENSEEDVIPADPEGIPLQQLYQLIGRERLIKLYAFFRATAEIDRQGLAVCDYGPIYARYTAEAARLVSEVLDTAIVPTPARFRVSRSANRIDPELWRLIVIGDADHVPIGGIKTDLYVHDCICPLILYTSTARPDRASSRNRIRQNALENAAVILLCWQARRKEKEKDHGTPRS